jgi:energy-converting hydrogenase Eha subunit B
MRGCKRQYFALCFEIVKTYVLGRVIGSPRDEGDLGACTLTVLELVLDVENSVTAANALLALAVLALGVEELLAEDRPVSLLGCLLNNNLLPVVADLVDDPLGVLAELELVEGADALGRDGNTGGVALAGGHGSDSVDEAVRQACARRT